MPRKPEPSYKLKKIIWDIAATVGTDNYSVIQRELDYRLEELRKDENEDFFEDIPDIRTIRRVIEVDIQRLPPEVVSKLPPHVWRLRHDYEEIKQLAPESVENEHKELITPALQKAQDEHLDNIRRELEGWRGRIFILDIAAVELSNYSSIPASFAAQKDIPLFKALNEHLPPPAYGSLWDDYDSWESKYIEYLRGHKGLRQQIVEEAKAKFNLPTRQEANKKLRLEVVPHVTESFATPFFMAFHYKSLGKELELKFDPPLPYPISSKGIVLEGLRVNNSEVLIAENVTGTYKSKYEAMVKQYLESNSVTNLIAFLSRLRKLTDKINIALDEILERRDYIHHTCRLCPVQGKV
jgi:hypothetical protein